MTKQHKAGILPASNLQAPPERDWCRFLQTALIGSASVMLFFNSALTFADETPGAQPAAGETAAAKNNPDNNSSAAQPLQGGVQMVELNLQVLRDLGLDIKEIFKAASSLYDEVTIQPVTIMTQPEVIGRGTIINIPIGFRPTGPGPQPKKKRVDLAMSQMRPIIQMLKQDIDDFQSGHRRLDISDEERQDLRPLFEQWIKLVNSESGNLVTLENLTKAPPYNNNAIASVALAIQTDGKKMDEVRRKLYKSVQKEGKKKKNK